MLAYTTRTLAGVVLALGTLTACSGGGPDERDAADELALALSSGDVSKVPSTTSGAENQTDLERIAEGLGDSTERVRVDTVTVADDGLATATLDHVRTLDGVAWEFQTEATFVEAEEQWELEWDPSVVADVEVGERLTVSTRYPERADILGAGDAPIVTSRPVLRVGIDKTQIAPPAFAPSATALARLLDIDPDAYVARVEAAGEAAFVEGLVLREGPDVPNVASVPGAVRLPDEIPLAPTRAFAQPLLGSVGEATAEVIEKSKGSIRAGDQVGLSGLQQRYDDQLRGTPSVEVSAIAEGAEPRRLFASTVKAGEPLRTTIDRRLQSAADKILADVGPASAIVAVSPSTGEILALANGPGGEGADIAASGRYAPGSTFKVVSALALLQGGDLTPKSTVPCTRTLDVDGRTFTNYSDYPSSALGDISLSAALANSCNTAFIASRERINLNSLATAAQALGLERDVDLGTPAFLGSMPTEAEGTAMAAAMIGQGQVEASPLTMAVVAASVRQGALVTPVLLPERTGKTADTPAGPITEAQAADLVAMMRGVVTDGSARFLADVPGEPVIAKTGTAEYGDETPPRTHAWMIAAQGDLAVAVFVADGDSGSATAGPLLERFLRAAG